MSTELASRPQTGSPPRTGEAPASWYSISGGNDQFWRVLAPAKAVGGKTFLLPEEPREDGEPSAAYSLQQPNDDSMFPWSFLINRNDPNDWEIQFPAHEGVAVWSRPDSGRAAIGLAMRHKLGIRTLAEVDDNYTGKRDNNVFMQGNRYSADDRLNHLHSMGAMHGIVFSTPWLRDVYHRIYTKELRYAPEWVPEMFVCGNHVAAEDWPARDERTGKLRVGWMGSPSHLWDVDLAWKAMLHAKQIGCEPVMIGFDPTEPWTTIHGGNPRRWLSGKSLKNIVRWKQVGFRHIGWVPPQKFRRFSLPLDIGLCPLQRNDFTLGKSDVKAVEYVIAGAAVVAQNIPVYSDHWVHGETALLANSPDEFARCVDLLARDDNLRERLVTAAQQYVRECRGTAQLREEWGAAIGC